MSQDIFLEERYERALQRLEHECSRHKMTNLELIILLEEALSLTLPYQEVKRYVDWRKRAEDAVKLENKLYTTSVKIDDSMDVFAKALRDVT